MMGGSEGEVVAEEEQRNIPRLPLFNPPPMMHSPERSGMVTPPLYTSGSVPFGWEEEPGKPRPCNALVSFTTPKSLELPPRLQLLDDDATKLSKVSKLPSPTTDLEGPYVCSNSYQPPSFRVSEDNSYGCSFGAERAWNYGYDTIRVLSKGVGIKEKGWFCLWRGRKAFKVRREVSRGSHVFPSSADRDTDDEHVGVTGGSHKKVRVTKMKRSGSFNNLFPAKLWTTICEGLKQLAPCKSKKLRKDGYGGLRF